MNKKRSVHILHLIVMILVYIKTLMQMTMCFNVYTCDAIDDGSSL